MSLPVWRASQKQVGSNALRTVQRCLTNLVSIYRLFDVGKYLSRGKVSNEPIYFVPSHAKCTCLKGEMVTYWIRPTSSLDASSATMCSFDSKIIDFGLTDSQSTDEKPTPSHTDRLVAWCTDILAKYLCQIVAFRGALKRSGRSDDNENVPKLFSKMVLTEVTEVVELPDYDPKLTRAMHSSEPDVQLSKEVLHQLRDFVYEVCSSYRSNPFHNFEVSV